MHFNLLDCFFEDDSSKNGKSLWKLDKFDYIYFVIYLITFFFIWICSSFARDFYSLLSYWDGPNYVYAAKTFYDIPNDNPWGKYFKFPKYYFACHLPGFPIVIKIFAILLFGNYWVGDVLAILSTSLLSIYLFRRLLLVYNCVKYIRWTTLLFLFLPIRMVIYRNVGASEPLYISFIFLSLIFYKLNKKMYMIFAMWGASFTRIEGLSIVGTIGLCYLLKFDILSAIFTSLGFLGFIFILLFHQYKFGDFTAYFKFNQGGQGLLNYPFSNIINNSYSTINRYKFLTQHLIMLIGLINIYNISLPFSIFSTIYFIYSTSLNHMDVYRYSLPGYILCLLVGLDVIWSSSLFKKHFLSISLFYLFALFFYSIGQITTNICGHNFLNEVMNQNLF